MSILSLPRRVARSCVVGVLAACVHVIYYLLHKFASQERPVLSDPVLWTCQVVWPALRLVDSDRINLRALRWAGEVLPDQEQQAWQSLMRELVEVRDRLVASESSPSRIYMELVKLLNDNWFVPRKLLLTRHPKPTLIENEETLVLAPVMVSRILADMRFPFRDGVVPAYRAQAIYPPPEPSLQGKMGYYDGRLNCAVVQSEECIKYVMFARSILNRRFRQIYLQGADTRDPRLWENWIDYYRRYCNSFADVQFQNNYVHHTTLIEEIRHGIDSIRVSRALPKAKDGEYYLGLPEVLLAPDSSIRKVLWEPLKADPSATLEKRVRFAKTISEMSAKMTAAALVGDPRHAFLEWFIRFEGAFARGVKPTDWPPADAALSLALQFLAALLRAVDDSIEWNSQDSSQLRSLHDKIMERYAEDLRFALKEIYRREFACQIDEPPFPEIDEEGKLHSERFYAAMGQVDALPE